MRDACWCFRIHGKLIIVLSPIRHPSMIKNEKMAFKVGGKLLQLDLWKILGDHYYDGPAIFYQYNYSLI